MDLNKVMNVISNRTFGGTDCALPMLYATKKKLNVDNFIIFTDNETWAGNIHPYKALENYKEKFNPNAKLIVCATANNCYTIADRATSSMKNSLGERSTLNIVGFDSAWPQLIREFSVTA